MTVFKTIFFFDWNRKWETKKVEIFIHQFLVLLLILFFRLIHKTNISTNSRLLDFDYSIFYRKYHPCQIQLLTKNVLMNIYSIDSCTQSSKVFRVLIQEILSKESTLLASILSSQDKKWMNIIGWTLRDHYLLCRKVQ